jgi:RNA polymerase sigma-70 factor, ECF subfamily
MKTDEQLIADYRQGQEEAWEELVNRYWKIVYGFVYFYVKNTGEAENLSQEVWLKCWQNLQRFDETKRFKIWLFAIAKNSAFDWLKKKKNLPFSNFTNSQGENILTETIADPAPLPDELLAREDMGTILTEALAKLELNQQTVLKMHLIDELNFREIAEILGEPLNSVKSRYRRSLLALRQILAENPGKKEK